MDLDQIKTFDRIAQDLSFTKAAARLNVTQATVSMRMRALEDLLGVTLFHRGRTITLTDQGMTFLPYARRMLAAAQEAKEALRRVERGRVSIGSLRSLVSPLITESLLRFQDKYPSVDVVINEGRQNQIATMLHEREIEMGILCWPNLDPLLTDLEPLLLMRERVPLVAAPHIVAELGPNPRIEEVLKRIPRLISIPWWQAYPDPALALFRRASVSVELPTGPARRLAVKGEGVGFFVMSSVASDLAAGRLAEITPSDMDPVHRDIAMVVRNLAVLDRPMLRDFAIEIASECASVGTVLESRLEPGRSAA
ncbi:LysR family transcriptional regulator [Devosia sp.]|uniref:LysR family transcriptional regulator n=1 Tax=Devosia sp. TaxID=1871048 RepID=UPI003BAA2854